MDSNPPDKGSAVRVFFEPKSVAAVGASRMPGKLGNTILKNLLTLKYEGQLFRIIEEARIPVFPSIGRAVSGLAALYRYSQVRVGL